MFLVSNWIQSVNSGSLFHPQNMNKAFSSSTRDLKPLLWHKGHRNQLSFGGGGPVSVVSGLVDRRLLDHLISVDGHGSPNALMRALQAVIVGSEYVHLARHPGWGEVCQVLAAFFLLVDLALMAIVATISRLRTAVFKDECCDQGCDDHNERHSDCDYLVNCQTWCVPIWLWWFDSLRVASGLGGALGFCCGHHSERPLGEPGCSASGCGHCCSWGPGGQRYIELRFAIVIYAICPCGSPVNKSSHCGSPALLRLVIAVKLELPPGSN